MRKQLQNNLLKNSNKNLILSRKYFSTQSKWPLQWDLESVWPEKLINNECVVKFKENIENMTDGKWQINVKYGVNKDLAFNRLTKKENTIIIGHSTYWKGLPPAASFFASIPFGMSRSEFLSWVTFAGGRDFWERMYKPLNLYPILAGDTGMQMGGWFPKKINTAKDFEGMRMRIEGLGGPMLAKMGVKLVDAPASKLLSMLEKGELDCCEFAVPVMDESAGKKFLQIFFYMKIALFFF